jgi:hypothetical protein
MHPIFNKAFFADLLAYLYNNMSSTVKMKDNFWGPFQWGKSVFCEAGEKMHAFC